MPASPALTRLSSGHYNTGDWNATTNQGGMGGDGHRQALVPPKPPQTGSYPVLTSDIAAVAAEVAADAQAAATASQAAEALAGTAITGLSTSTLTISTGTLTLLTETQKAWVPGMRLRIGQVMAPNADFMDVQVTSYDATSGALTASVTAIGGGGTHASWSLRPLAVATQSQFDARISSTDAVTPALLAHGLGLTGTSVAAASTLTLPGVGDDFAVTGSGATIIGISARTPAGRVVRTKMTGANTLVHSSALSLFTATSIQTAPGDIIDWKSTAAGWEMIGYGRASGLPLVVPPISLTRSARTSNTTLGAADRGTLIDVIAGTFTQTFSAAATLGNAWWCYFRNSGTGEITLDPNESEVIDGLTSYLMYPGECRLIQCSGTSFNTVVITPFRKQFDTSATFITPPGYANLLVEGWGAGGGGGGGRRDANGTLRGGGGGGGGGGYNQVILPSSLLSSSVSVTIGAGGTGGAGAATDSSGGNNGTTGGNTTFGSFLAAYGGGQGLAPSDPVGGGGGGTLSAGGFYTGGGPVVGSQYSNFNQAFGGGTGCGPSSADTTKGGASGWGGGGGGYGGNASIVTNPGGGSTLGGGGGGGGARIDSSNSAVSGASGGSRTAPSGGGGSGGGTGSSGSTGTDYCGGGGGGPGLGTSAGHGGAGGTAGGGGGGGGSANGFNSGSGGNGGNGRVIVYGGVK